MRQLIPFFFCKNEHGALIEAILYNRIYSSSIAAVKEL